MTQTSEVLNTAADMIEEQGWRQGAGGWGLCRSDQRLCLEGGIMAALGIDFDTQRGFYDCPAHNAVAAYLERDPQPRMGPIKDALWQWNDMDERTAAEVIGVLRAAAVIEAAREEQDAAWETYAGVVTA